METRGSEPPEVQRPYASLILYSFGFKYGVPIDATIMIDVRFLPNPYWQQELRPLSGLHPTVSEYVLASRDGTKLLNLLRPLLCFWATAKGNGGKLLRLAIGCTGGRHRSVAIVEYLQTYLVGEGLNPTTFHRDLHRDVQ